MENGKKEKKRSGDDSDLDSPEEKRVRTDSDLDSSEFTRVDSSEFTRVDSSEPNRIPNDILDILDEPDTATDCEPAIQYLDSVIRSFEEEILHPSPQPQQPLMFPLVSPEFGGSQPDLGYLLEASDDELGLPPTVSPSDEQTKTKMESGDPAFVAPAAAGLSENSGYEDELPSYDSFGFGIGEETQHNNGEFVTLGGLFDYDSADYSEFLYRSESLHALYR